MHAAVDRSTPPGPGLDLPGTDHPAPAMPRRPWLMHMAWHDLLFMHWPLDPARLRPHVPRGLELETFDGVAWLGVVPFWMSNVRPRWVPPIPGLSRFAELNVRTYVRTTGGKPGVWFFSLDAASKLAVWAARKTFHLPYYNARMSVDVGPHDEVRYASTRTHADAPPAELRMAYRPTGPVYHTRRGDLDDWLTYRLCLYAADAQGNIYRADIHHAPWPLQPAAGEIERNTMAEQIGIELTDPPALWHFSKRIDTVAWWRKRVLEVP